MTLFLSIFSKTPSYATTNMGAKTDTADINFTLNIEADPQGKEENKDPDNSHSQETNPQDENGDKEKPSTKQQDVPDVASAGATTINQDTSNQILIFAAIISCAAASILVFVLISKNRKDNLKKFSNRKLTKSTKQNLILSFSTGIIISLPFFASLGIKGFATSSVDYSIYDFKDDEYPFQFDMHDISPEIHGEQGSLIINKLQLSDFINTDTPTGYNTQLTFEGQEDCAGEICNSNYFTNESRHKILPIESSKTKDEFQKSTTESWGWSLDGLTFYPIKNLDIQNPTTSIYIAVKTLGDTPTGHYRLTGKFKLTATTNPVDEKFDIFTLEYDTEGGQGHIEDQEALTYIDAGRTFDITTITPEKEGYNFAGWTNEKNSTIKIESSTFLANSKNTTLYAIWDRKPTTYRITLNLNDQDSEDKVNNATGQQLIFENTNNLDYFEFQFPNWEPTRDGYNFIGWSSQDDTNTPEWSKNTTLRYEQMPPSTNTIENTYYAIWGEKEKCSASILFDTNGGTELQQDINFVQSNVICSELVTKYYIPSEIPAKEHNIFRGWGTLDESLIFNYDQNNNSFSPSYIDIQSNTAITLYAIWEEEPKNIFTLIYKTIDENGEEVTFYTDTFQGEYEITHNFELIKDSPVRQKYDFIGWNTQSSSENQPTSFEDNTIAANVGENYLYATWKAKTPKIMLLTQHKDETPEERKSKDSKYIGVLSFLYDANTYTEEDELTKEIEDFELSNNTFKISKIYDSADLERDFSTSYFNELPDWDTDSSNVTAIYIDQSFKEYEISSKSTAKWFYGLDDVTKFSGITNINLKSVTHLNSMFHRLSYDAESEFILDLENWNIGDGLLEDEKINMNSMFELAGNHASTFEIKLSDWDVSKVSTMESMFYSSGYYAKEYRLNLSNWDTSSVTNMNRMFTFANGDTCLLECDNNDYSTFMLGDINTHMVNIDDRQYKAWNVSNVKNMDSMFYGAFRIARNFELEISRWNISQLTDISSMFAYAGTESETWNIGNINTQDNIILSDNSTPYTAWNVSNVEEMDSMFSFTAPNASEFNLDLSKWDTSNVTTMSGMFQADVINMNCYGSSNNRLWKVEGLKNFNVKNVETMSYMFAGLCSNFISEPLDLSGWQTDSLTTTSFMFNDFGINRTINLSGWTNLVLEDANNMFSSSTIFPEEILKRDELTVILDGFNTNNITNMTNMFGNTAIKSLNLASFNTENVKNMKNMFEGIATEILDLSTFDISKVTNFEHMFKNSSVKTIVATDWDIIMNDKANDNEMFLDAKNLRGGEGTTYYENKIDRTYAHIDHKNDDPSNPGYFTTPENNDEEE